MGANFDYSPCSVRAKSDHTVAVAGGEVRESNTAGEDIGDGGGEQGLDLGPKPWWGGDTSGSQHCHTSRNHDHSPVFRHVGSGRDLGETLNNGFPSGAVVAGITTPFVVVQSWIR